tara:strand:- start:335 stop:1873 length:1539 start_codon:yes stop_codon:yes gene_type:complete
MKIKNALISVSDKNKIKNILKVLKKYKINIISSGGTYKKIKQLGYDCIEVSKYTNFPEILNGRVKTLHPKIHSGILYKRSIPSHKNIIKMHNFESIDLVITNFYPFQNTIDRTNNHNKIIENIDIGGPTLVRSAAKNYIDVVVITKISQYEQLVNELNSYGGKTSLKFRAKMSREAFGETANYDAAIYNYLNTYSKIKIPDKIIVSANLIEHFRYGENPHQFGAIYNDKNNFRLKKLQGKDFSYNNYNDIFACLKLMKTLPTNKGVVIIKHSNPSGVSIENDHLRSYISALNCDPVSAFGGVVGCNFKINLKIAKEMIKQYYEIIIGNGFDKAALKLLNNKKKLKLIDSSKMNFNRSQVVHSGINSFLMQEDDSFIFKKKNFKIVSKKKPSKKLMEQIIFSFNVCRSVKSNAIVITQNNKTLGIGSGQPSRIDSCDIAVKKMNNFQQKNNDDELIAASDAFFPFVDGIEKLVQAGVSVVVQPFGSIRDKEIIKFANEMGIVLVFSKTRHFNH